MSVTFLSFFWFLVFPFFCFLVLLLWAPALVWSHLGFVILQRFTFNEVFIPCSIAHRVPWIMHKDVPFIIILPGPLCI